MSMASISPSPEAPVQQDLPSPGVGEDFHLHRRLNKSREKYVLGFSAKWRSRLKGGPETMPEGETGIGGAPSQVGRATCPRVRHLSSFPPRGPSRMILSPTVFLQVKN